MVQTGNPMTVVECKAILFDLDGTLIDSRLSIDIAYKAWCGYHGLDFREVLSKAHGRRTVDTVRLLLPHKNLLEEVARLEDLECSAIDGLVALSGAKQLINELSSSHWAIVTSGSRRLAIHRLHHCGIKQPSVFIVAEDVEKGKPDPEGYKKAADLLGVSYADCVVFEDAPAGIKAARGAGMRSIAFPTTHVLEELNGADICVENLEKLSIQVGDTLKITVQEALWSAKV
jgi:sugar-phosphatase